MPKYAAPIDNFRFVLYDVLAVRRRWSSSGLTEATLEVLEAVIEEAGKLCNVLQPLNLSGDTEGCACARRRFQGSLWSVPRGRLGRHDRRSGLWLPECFYAR